VGEPTGRHTLVLTFTNRAKEPCGLDGYPVIVVRSTVRALPFEMRQAGDEVVTGARPRPVRVEARGRAYVVIDKYRCDARDRGRARRVVVQVPGAKAGERLTVPLPRDGSDFSFCGKGDPGSTISISPFEPSLTAALRRH
jgi:hypothetical protein